VPGRDTLLVDGAVPKDLAETQMSLEWPLKVIVNTDKVRMGLMGVMGVMMIAPAQ
jgi:hypothetical protein